MKALNIHRWRGVAVAVVAACVLGPAARAQAGAGDPVADLRAVAIARIRHYVTWPGDLPRPAGPAPVTACVVGDSPALVDALQRQSTMHGPLTVRQLGPHSPELATCGIAVFHDLGAAETATALRSLRTHRTLTIGESASFVREGGMLALVERRQRLRMVVNLANTRRAGLGLSSRLLQLAQVVDGSAP